MKYLNFFRLVLALYSLAHAASAASQVVQIDSIVVTPSSPGVCDTLGIDILRTEPGQAVGAVYTYGDELGVVLTLGNRIEIVTGSPVSTDFESYEIELPRNTEVVVNGVKRILNDIYLFGYRILDPTRHEGYVTKYSLVDNDVAWHSSMGESGRITYTGFDLGNDSLAVVATDHNVGQDVVIHYLSKATGTAAGLTRSYGGIDAESCYDFQAREGGYNGSGRFSHARRGSPGMRHALTYWAEDFTLEDTYGYFRETDQLARQFATHLTNVPGGSVSVSYGTLDASSSRSSNLYLLLADTAGRPRISRQIRFPSTSMYCLGLTYHRDQVYLHAYSRDSPFTEYLLALSPSTLGLNWAVRMAGVGSSGALSSAFTAFEDGQLYLTTTLQDALVGEVLYALPVPVDVPTEELSCRPLSELDLPISNLPNVRVDIPIQATSSQSPFRLEQVTTASKPVSREDLLCDASCPPTCENYEVYTSVVLCEEVTAFTLPDGRSVSDTGRYQSFLSTVDDCDSIIFTYVRRATAESLELSFDLCNGDTISVFGTAFASGGTYNQPLSGGDCLITAQITITQNPTYTLTDTLQVCTGDSLLYAGTYYAAGESTVVTEQTTLGCDSVTAVAFADVSGRTAVLRAQICQGTSYAFGGVNYASAGTYTTTDLNAAGCDSVTTLMLGVVAQIQTETILRRCRGDSVQYLGQWYTRDTVLRTQYTAVGGCDSTHRVTIVEDDGPGVAADVTPSCTNTATGALDVSGQGFGPFTYDWGGGGGTLPRRDSLLPGDYILSITDANGCTNDVVLAVPSRPPVSFAILAADPSCEGTVDAEIALSPPDSLRSSVVGPFRSPDHVYAPLPGGQVYAISAVDVHGCAYDLGSILLDDGPPQAYAEYPDTISLQLGTRVRVRPDRLVADSIRWTDELGALSCLNCDAPYAQPVTNTYVYIDASMDGNCPDADTVLLRVTPGPDVYFPTAFSPNGDATNDRWRPQGAVNVDRLLELLIFDRWGGLVVTQRDLDWRDPLLGWDGTMAGKPMDPAVFVYYVRYRLLDGTELENTGDITLVR